MDICSKVLAGVQRCCKPRYIILYGEKVTAGQRDLKSADFCIVLDQVNRQALLHDLYLTVQADIPVQFLLYSTEEWNALTADPNSYASAIRRKGTILYGEAT
ncbi:MAG: hypothetical protein Q4F79_13345 [Eubacteriales bacterium]|nr:hypothetical protein [Eubacteriales bacterium]